MCKHVKLYLTNEYLSPFRAYRLCFLHPVSFVELNFKNYFRGFLSVRSWNAFFFYSYYLSNKGRKWVLICPLISQNSDCLTSLCSVCSEGAHRLLFLKLFCFAPEGSGQISVFISMCLQTAAWTSCTAGGEPSAWAPICPWHLALCLLCTLVPLCCCAG